MNKNILMPWSSYDFRVSCDRSYLDPVNKWPTRNRYRNIGKGYNNNRNTMSNRSSFVGKYSMDP